jgi:putative ubiquitin-RnfH superfamily antitoxin RatB of RatAB toxin-antitoxin module
MVEATLHVTVLASPRAREVSEWILQMPAGATVRQALQAAGLAEGDAGVGIWGRRCTPDAVLRDGDRVEVYRPLVVDPKVARRERFRKQGARAAGLFARKR